jgi:hypothetical protein
VRGRRIADKAHRFTAYTLIIFSGIAMCVTAYGTVSLITHSRRMKRAWIERELDRLDDARKAFLAGTASAEQLHLLEQERAGQEMEEAREREKERKKEAGIWGQVREAVGAQVSRGQMGEETERQRERRLARQRGETGQEWLVADAGAEPGILAPGTKVKEAVKAGGSEIPGVGFDSKGRPVPAGRVEYVTRTVEEDRNTGEKRPTVRAAGPLDVMADNAISRVTDPAVREGKSWLSWMKGEKKSAD